MALLVALVLVPGEIIEPLTDAGQLGNFIGETHTCGRTDRGGSRRSRDAPGSASSRSEGRGRPGSTERTAGALLVVLPVMFNLCFALLARSFDYPDILRRPTSEVLSRFRAGGSRLLLLWWAFALTAILLAPVAVLLASPSLAPTLAWSRSPSRLACWPRQSSSSAWSAGPSWFPTSPGPTPMPKPARPSRGHRHRLPVVPPLSRSRRRRASRLPVHRCLECV